MVEVAVPLAAPVVGEVVKILSTESTFNIRHIIALSKNLDETYKQLIQDLEWLLQVEKDNEREVQRLEDKDTNGAYNLWKNNVAKIAGEVHELRTEYEGRRLPWWRILRRSRLSEQMDKLRRLVCDLLQKGSLKDFLVDKEPQCVLKELDVPEIMRYETLQNAFRNVLDLIKDSNTKAKAIGVYGIKGVGKTGILQNLNNNVEVAQLFDIVIFMGMSTNRTLEELRLEIADRLLVKIDGIMDSKEVARRIHKRLENRKYLLILDGVVEFINLRELRIPDGNNCGKVVMASHIHQVLKWNNVDTLINVKPLSRHEAWKMFQDIVGDEIIELPGIRPIARRVCKRCSCLPLLIQKIASSFKWKTDARSWNAGLKALKPWPEHGIEGVEELYKCLKFCFEELKDEKKQKCFLYSSMYPANSKVYTDYLVECWAAQGFLGDVNDTCYQDVRDKGHEIVDDLVNVSLLEKGERKIYVRMHDCIRQLALHISSKSPDCHTYVLTSENSIQPDNSKAMKNSRWVSMVDSKLTDLPNGLGSVMLSTVLLQKNTELAVIYQTFFENMTNLVVLDLYGTRIEELPSSLSTLIALKGLYLNDCMLLTLLPSEIASLQCLQVLDVRGSGVPFIPIPIKSLANLKCLRISYVTRADQYGDHVILELHKLEELIINVVSYQQWCKDAEHVMQQVACLKNLSTLKCSFPSASMLEEFLLISKSWQDDKPFNSFPFFVGCQYSKCPQILECFDYRMNKYLKYCDGDRNDDFVNSRVLAHTEAFELICHKNIRNLSDFAGTTSLKYVRSFLIKGCNKMSSIVAGDIAGNGNRQENESILPNLQHLCMDTLLNLKHVFRGPLHSGTLFKLQVLILKNCPSLKTIFFRVATTDFPKLQMLIIENCSEIEGLLMFKEVTERERNVLPRLEKLLLNNLPIFKSICTKETLAWPSLELLEIYDCPALKSLPFGMDNAANLRSIKGQKEWWDNLEWTNNKAKEQLQIIFKAS